ncbi:MAG: hypothetical protein RLZZ500_1109 [Bacteroidota bacterium]|jgi:AcrR family transcriptional regulator
MKTVASKRQEEIISVAGQLIRTKGLKGLTTKNLALEMGFSESALYRHFKNKEDIIVLLLNHLADTMQKRFEDFPNEEISAVDQLQQLFANQFHFFYHNPQFVVAVLSEGLFDETETIKQAIQRIITLKSQLLMSIVEQGKKNKELKTSFSSEEFVHILMGSFRLIMLKWKFSNFTLDLLSKGNTQMHTTIQLLQA